MFAYKNPKGEYGYYFKLASCFENMLYQNYPFQILKLFKWESLIPFLLARLSDITNIRKKHKELFWKFEPG